jgi:2-phospho-L-lactate guanylyltransferase
VQVAVVVPVRAFSDAKQRLATVLGESDRAALARRLATNVVHAAGELPVYVVCDDDEVADWARAEGADVLWRPAAGLNDAVTFATEAVARSGFSQALVAHGDLPHARDLSVVTGFDGVTLVPDRHDDGTNVVCLPLGRGFRFAYGPGSFTRHQVEAGRAGLALRVLRDRSLAWDVDVPADLVDEPDSAPADC